MYRAVSFCLVTSLDIHLCHISHRSTALELSHWNAVTTRDICDIIPQQTHWLAYESPIQTILSLIRKLISTNTPSIFGVNSQLFGKAKQCQVIFRKERICRTTYWWMQQQYRPELCKFLKSIRAFSDHRTVGNLRSTQEKPPRTKTLVSMPTRPLLGDSSFQAIFIQHLRCSLREGLVGSERRWVVGGGEETQLC